MWAVLLVMAVALAGCSAGRDVGIRYLEDESLEFFVPLCGKEQLRQLWLEDITDLDGVGDGEVLWRLRAAGSGSTVSTISFGEAPAGLSTGLTSLPELADQYGGRSLRINVETDRSSRLVGTFTLTELPTNGSAVLFDGGDDKVLSVDQLVAGQRDECSPSSPLRRTAAGLALCIPVGAVAGWLIVRRRRRRPPAVTGGASSAR